MSSSLRGRDTVLSPWTSADASELPPAGFPGAVGKTSSQDDFSSLLDDVETHLFAPFDDDTVVWPGHGDPTTLGAERPHLDEWRTRGW